MTQAVRRHLQVPPLVWITYLGIGLVLFGALFFAVRAATVVDARIGVGVAIGTAVVGATLLRSASQRVVSTIGVVVLVVLGADYVVRFFDLADPAATVETMLADSVFLLGDGTLLQIHGIENWLIAVVTPATFLAWYFLLRGDITQSVLAAGGLVTIFTLTGDLSNATTLVAISGGVIAIGANRLYSHGGSLSGVDSVLTVAAAIVIISLTVFSFGGMAAVGAGPGEPTGTDDDDIEEDAIDEAATNLEETLTTRQELELSGPVDLDPEPRFIVESNESTLFRTEVYDRYTGDGWVRTDETADSDPLPEGNAETIEQTFEIVTPMQSLPTAAMPATVDGLDGVEYQQTADGLLQADGPVEAETEYSVTTEQVNASAATLNAAGDDYPEAVADQYTQLPSDVPDRVRDLTADVTADAETPYETARVTQEYLMRQKEYSLDVPPPEGNIADEFLFEMEAGYCTYYATTMAVMLRAEGIPARVVSGYSTGHEVDDETRAVLGSNAHAWVEVYFPDVGWVTFDPTPPADWEQARLEVLDDAETELNLRQETNTTATEDTDTGTVDSDVAAIEDPRDDPQTREDLESGLDVDEVDPADYGAAEELPQLPAAGQTPQLLLWGILLMGLTTIGIRFTPVRNRLQPVRLSYQRRRSAPSDIDRAVDRMEWLLGWQYTPRRASETPTEYLHRLPTAVDPRVKEVYSLYETARYAGTADNEQIDRAVSLVNSLIRERIPLLGRVLKRR